MVLGLYGGYAQQFHTQSTRKESPMIRHSSTHAAMERPPQVAEASPPRLPLDLWRDIQSRVDGRTFISTLGLSRGHRNLPSLCELQERVQTPSWSWPSHGFGSVKRPGGVVPNDRNALVALCVKRAHAADRIAENIRRDNFQSYGELGTAQPLYGSSRYVLQENKLVDLATNAAYALFPVDQIGAYSMELSDNSRYLLAQRHPSESADAQASLLVWDLQNGKPEPFRFAEFCAERDVSPNVDAETQDFWTRDWSKGFSRTVGCDVYVAFTDGSVPRLFTLSGHTEPVGCVALSLTEGMLVTISANEAFLWTFENDAPAAERIDRVFREAETGFALSRDLLFVQEIENQRRSGRLWERTQNGWEPHVHPVSDADLSDDLRFFVVEEPEGVLLCEFVPDTCAKRLDASVLQATYELEADDSDIDSDDGFDGRWSFDDNNSRLLRRNSDDAQFWIGVDGAEPFQLPGLSEQGWPDDLIVSRDGDYAFLVQNGKLQGWDMRDPVIKKISVPDLPSNFSVVSLVCCEQTVWACSQNAVWCWPMAFKEGKVLNVSNVSGDCSDISPEGFLVLSAHNVPGDSSDISPEGFPPPPSIATLGCDTNTVYIVDVRHPDCPIARLPVPSDRSVSCRFTDDGTRVVIRTIGKGSAWLVDLLNRECPGIAAGDPVA
jgi:hypothetical protein